MYTVNHLENLKKFPKEHKTVGFSGFQYASNISLRQYAYGELLHKYMLTP